MKSSSDKTLEQKIAAIQALDFEMIKYKATRKEDGYGWSPEHADRVEVSYKRYLILMAKHPEATLVPDQDTDHFWHMHILDTQKYARDCAATLGYFLHHFPYLGLRGEEDAKASAEAFRATQQLYAQEFGAACGVDTAAYCARADGTQAEQAYCAAQAPQASQAYCAAQAPQASQAYCAAQAPQASQAYCAAQAPQASQAYCAAQVASTD